MMSSIGNDKKINVAILDVFQALDSKIKTLKIVDDISDLNEMDYKKLPKEVHGELCKQIIKKNSVAQTNVICIDYLNKELSGSIEKLKTVLEWCLNNDIDLINLSCGTTKYSDLTFLKKICRKLYNKGVLIVAAVSNNDSYTIPANLPYTISVASGSRFKNLADINCEKTFIVEFENDNDTYLDNSNSFATAYITSELCKLLKANRNKKKYNYDAVQHIIKTKKMHTVYINSVVLNYATSIFFMDMDIENFSTNNIIQNNKNLVMSDINSLTPSDICNKHCDIVVFPNDITRKKMVLLKDIIKRNYVYSLIYCGKAPIFIYLFCLRHGIKLWDERCCIISRRKFKTTPKTVPIIMVKGTSNKAVFDVVKSLENLFSRRKKNVLMASSIMFSYIYGYLFVPKVSNGYLLNIIDYFCPDIIVIALQEHDFLKETEYYKFRLNNEIVIYYNNLLDPNIFDCI